MGQVLRRASASSPSPSQVKKRPSPSLPSQPIIPPIHPGVIIEPGHEASEWDRSDPLFKTMSQQLAGKILTKPGAGKPDPWQRTVTPSYSRPKPTDRRAGTGPTEDTDVPLGFLNTAKLKHIFELYQGLDAEGKPIGVKGLAEKYKVDASLLENVLIHCAPLKTKVNKDENVLKSGRPM